MNFFKSVFADDPEEETSDSESTPTSPSNSQSQSSPSPPSNPNPQIATVTSAWSFGSSLIKTLASKSESVIETYRRDLEEFSSGLKKETDVIREAASRAVKDLPTSLEAGAAVAQESLESVGQAIDNLGSTVGEIIAHGKDSILAAADYSDSEVSDSKLINNSSYNSVPYSRLDAQIRMIQCDMSTYLEEVEDLGDYSEWKLGFVLEDRVDEIEDLIAGNGVIEEIYNEIVPGRVEEEVFWSRYFYRVYKVKKAEEARAMIVKRAIAGEEEEELSWDVDEDEYEESGVSKLQGKVEESRPEKAKTEVEHEMESLRKGNGEEVSVSEFGNVDVVDQKGDSERRLDEAESHSVDLEPKFDEKTSEGKTDKDSDFSVVSSQLSREEEDLGWDEIEDIGDETKVVSRESPDKAELRKRLTTAEEEEDLTWDIEDDDDEPVRS